MTGLTGFDKIVAITAIHIPGGEVRLPARSTYVDAQTILYCLTENGEVYKVINDKFREAQKVWG